MQCAGAAGAILGSGSSIGTFLFLEVGLSDPTSRMIDRGIACGLLIAALAVLFAKRRALFFAAAAWFAVEAVMAGYLGGFFAATLSPFARAIRYLAPLAIAAMITGDEKRAEKLLVAGSAFVFAAHGIEALLLNPRFVDFLIVTIDRAAHFRMSQTSAEAWLFAIGAVDVALALLVVLRPSRTVLGYMAFWGFATAIMRTVYFGPEIGWHHTLIRALNGAAPLALLLGMRRPVEEAVPLGTGMGQTWPEPTSTSH